MNIPEFAGTVVHKYCVQQHKIENISKKVIIFNKVLHIELLDKGQDGPKSPKPCSHSLNSTTYTLT